MPVSYFWDLHVWKCGLICTQLKLSYKSKLVVSEVENCIPSAGYFTPFNPLVHMALVLYLYS